jgi:ABC-type uncharacterized transport system auxiliary subunit
MKINRKKIWEYWIYFIHILAGIAIAYFLTGCKTSKSGCDAYSLQWDKDIDTLIVYKNNELYLPKTPANNAKQIHFNDIDKGEYIVTLLKNGKVIETKKLNINK